MSYAYRRNVVTQLDEDEPLLGTNQEFLATELAKAIDNFGWLVLNTTQKNDTLSPQSPNKKLNSPSFLSKSRQPKKFFRGIWRRMTNKSKQKDKVMVENRNAFTIVKSDHLEQLLNVCVKVMEHFETEAVDNIENETKMTEENEENEIKTVVEMEIETKSADELEVETKMVGKSESKTKSVDVIDSDMEPDNQSVVTKSVDFIDGEPKPDNQSVVISSEQKSVNVQSSWVTFEKDNDIDEEIALNNESLVRIEIIDGRKSQNFADIQENYIEKTDSILTEHTLPTPICNYSIRSDGKCAPSVTQDSTIVNDEEFLPLMTPTTFCNSLMKTEFGISAECSFKEDEGIPLITPQFISPSQNEEDHDDDLIKWQDSIMAYGYQVEQMTSSCGSSKGERSSADMGICDKTVQSEMNMDEEELEPVLRSNLNKYLSSHKENQSLLKSEDLQSITLEPYAESEKSSSAFGKIFRGSVDSTMSSLKLSIDKETTNSETELSERRETQSVATEFSHSSDDDEPAVDLNEMVEFHDEEAELHPADSDIPSQPRSSFSRFFGTGYNYNNAIVRCETYVDWFKKFLRGISQSFSDNLVLFLNRFPFIRTNPAFVQFLRK